MKKYKIVTYDLLGNDEDGYEINDCFSTETIELDPQNMSDFQIIQMMDFINPKDVEITSNSDIYTLYFQTIDTGKPLCMLQIME